MILISNDGHMMDWALRWTLLMGIPNSTMKEHVIDEPLMNDAYGIIFTRLLDAKTHNTRSSHIEDSLDQYPYK
jgi:hypothetical protein